MFWMNAGSSGDIPPSTRVKPGLSAATASAASLTISAYFLQSGSISKSQCDLLLGSFQNITASIMIPPGINGAATWPARFAPANEPFLFGMVDDFKTCAPQLAFNAGAIGDPPIGGVAGIIVLDEVHARKFRGVEDGLFPEVVVLRQRH